MAIIKDMGLFTTLNDEAESKFDSFLCAPDPSCFGFWVGFRPTLPLSSAQCSGMPGDELLLHGHYTSIPSAIAQ